MDNQNMNDMAPPVGGNSGRYLSSALNPFGIVSQPSTPLAAVETRMYNDLWNAIIDRKLRAGSKLEEVTLAEIYGVSRTVVRKVMVIMERDGIVSLPLNRGAYVVTPSPRDAVELCETALVFTRYVVDKLANNHKKITAGHRKNLESHLAQERAAEREGNFHIVRRLRIEHTILLALASDNQNMAASMERISTRLALALSTYQNVPGHSADASYSADLMSAIFSGNRDRAIELVEKMGKSILGSMQLDPKEDTPDLRAILRNP